MRFWACARLVGLPELKSSRKRTLCPAARSASTRCEPMKPAPPVTRQCATQISMDEGSPEARYSEPPGSALTRGVKSLSQGLGVPRPWASARLFRQLRLRFLRDGAHLRARQTRVDLER